ncbi:HU family DNA-binding protein [Deinococcus sp. Leaf326]|uniref:HU family DNA-binding protein n=1 Tax=Deinococcus sp. Leaf326 TaxID=1736338 RepID=UPI0006FB0BCC|nr:HU family DNA-binding protein [Deinococcus sp. Leaf326]KQR26983.1 hypothetical protein ASF71_17990 [Deinococcus sp. Leaf326]
MSVSSPQLPSPTASPTGDGVTLSNLQIAYRLICEENDLKDVAEAQRILDQLATIIFLSLSEGNDVNLKNIGTFTVESTRSHKNNLRPGEICPARRRGKFRLARFLQDGF